MPAPGLSTAGLARCPPKPTAVAPALHRWHRGRAGGQSQATEAHFREGPRRGKGQATPTRTGAVGGGRCQVAEPPGDGHRPLTHGVCHEGSYKENNHKVHVFANNSRERIAVFLLV